MKSLVLLMVLGVLACCASAGYLRGWSGGYGYPGSYGWSGGHGYGYSAPVVVKRVVYSSPSYGGWNGYGGGYRSYGGYGYGGWGGGWW